VRSSSQTAINEDKHDLHRDESVGGVNLLISYVDSNINIGQKELTNNLIFVYIRKFVQCFESTFDFLNFIDFKLKISCLISFLETKQRSTAGSDANLNISIANKLHSNSTKSLIILLSNPSPFFSFKLHVRRVCCPM